MRYRIESPPKYVGVEKVQLQREDRRVLSWRGIVPTAHRSPQRSSGGEMSSYEKQLTLVLLLEIVHDRLQGRFEWSCLFAATPSALQMVQGIGRRGCP